MASNETTTLLRDGTEAVPRRRKSRWEEKTPVVKNPSPTKVSSQPTNHSRSRERQYHRQHTASSDSRGRSRDDYRHRSRSRSRERHHHHHHRHRSRSRSRERHRSRSRERRPGREGRDGRLEGSRDGRDGREGQHSTAGSRSKTPRDERPKSTNNSSSVAMNQQQKVVEASVARMKCENRYMTLLGELEYSKQKLNVSSHQLETIVKKIEVFEWNLVQG